MDDEYTRMLEEGWEEDDEEEEEEEEEEEKRERTPSENIDLARSALEHMSEEWLQNEFGDEVTDVIFDALTCYIEQEQKKLSEVDTPSGI